jgi:hypothetical protein
MARNLPSALHNLLYPTPPRVRCALCLRVVGGRLVSAMRGGDWHPYAHKDARCDGQRCPGHRQAGVKVGPDAVDGDRYVAKKAGAA